MQSQIKSSVVVLFKVVSRSPSSVDGPNGGWALADLAEVVAGGSNGGWVTAVAGPNGGW